MKTKRQKPELQETCFPKNYLESIAIVQHAVEERSALASKLGKNILLTIKVCDGIVHYNFKPVMRKKDK